MINPIALTQQSKKRLAKVRRLRIPSRRLSYNSIDITRDYTKIYQNDIKGFEKLISDENFMQKQINWLS